MSTAAYPRARWFWVGFLVVTLVVAGGVSYLASASPDGLDSATLRGCQVLKRGGADELVGQCIAQSAHDHAMAASPLADYTVGGVQNSGGAAGVIGVVITLALAGGLFRVIARGSRG